MKFTALIEKLDDGWWIGQLEKLPEVLSQGKTINKQTAVGRHPELSDLLCKKICKQLQVPKIK